MLYLVELAFLLVPVAVLVSFIVALCMYISARRKNKREPERVDERNIRAKKTALVVCSVLLCAVIAMIVALAVLMYMAVAYM